MNRFIHTPSSSLHIMHFKFNVFLFVTIVSSLKMKGLFRGEIEIQMKHSFAMKVQAYIKSFPRSLYIVCDNAFRKSSFTLDSPAFKLIALSQKFVQLNCITQQAAANLKFYIAKFKYGYEITRISRLTTSKSVKKKSSVIWTSSCVGQIISFLCNTMTGRFTNLNDDRKHIQNMQTANIWGKKLKVIHYSIQTSTGTPCPFLSYLLQFLSISIPLLNHCSDQRSYWAETVWTWWDDIQDSHFNILKQCDLLEQCTSR